MLQKLAAPLVNAFADPKRSAQAQSGALSAADVGTSASSAARSTDSWLGQSYVP
jgi:hypothetical protein